MKFYIFKDRAEVVHILTILLLFDVKLAAYCPFYLFSRYFDILKDLII